MIFHAEQYIVNIAPLQMHLLVVNQFFKSSYYSTEDHNCPFCSKCYYIGLVALFLSSHRTLSPHPGMLTEGPWQWPPPTTPCLTPPPMERPTAPWCGAHWNPQTPLNPGAWAACGLHPHYGPLPPSATRRWGAVIIYSLDIFMFFGIFFLMSYHFLFFLHLQDLSKSPKSVKKLLPKRKPERKQSEEEFALRKSMLKTKNTPK